MGVGSCQNSSSRDPIIPTQWPGEQDAPAGFYYPREKQESEVEARCMQGLEGRHTG